MINRLFRFFQIDLQYFLLPLPFLESIRNIFFTDFSLIINLLKGKKKFFAPVRLNDKKVFYDTPYSTKTFLAAIYDFYVESQRNTILESNSVIVDVGANIGQYMTAAKTFLPDARVYSFEPDTEIFNILKNNAAQYKNVKVFNLALSDKEGIEKFYKSVEFSEWSSLNKSAISGESKEVKIKTNVGDKVLKDLSEIDLLKVDVEGAEFKVIKGLTKTLKKSKYLLIEISILRNRDDLGSSELIKYLLDNGFYIYSIGRVFSAGIGREQGAVDILFKNRKL